MRVVFKVRKMVLDRFSQPSYSSLLHLQVLEPDAEYALMKKNGNTFPGFLNQRILYAARHPVSAKKTRRKFVSFAF